MARTANMVAWIKDQSTAITKVYQRIDTALTKLSKKTSRKRVHQARVALRHLFALWPILCEDGWQTKSFEKRVMKPLDGLLTQLGTVRNNDVNLILAKELDCPPALMKKWSKKRQKSNRKLKQHVKSMDIKSILKEMKVFFAKQPQTVSQRIAKSTLAKENPAKHILNALQKQEHVVKTLAMKPSTPQEFHQLRLAVKQWRYLLDDLCSTSNESLEYAQGALGKLHDLDRIRPLLQGDEKLISCLANLNNMHRKLLFELYDVQEKLPFGFDPTRNGAALKRKSS